MQTTTIEYLDLYRQALEHQQAHGEVMPSFGPAQPSEHCMACLREKRSDKGWHEVKRRYSWAIPNEAALRAIAECSPRGVVEIGAGGGYWAKLLRERGVDVIAYDPEPGGGQWFQGEPWTEVLTGDHTSVIGHPGRTLLMVWPMYDTAWTHEAVELYSGDTVVYVGEGHGGCTGTDRMHELLGAGHSCWNEPCMHDRPAAQFEGHELSDDEINDGPSWAWQVGGALNQVTFTAPEIFGEPVGGDR
ncbi:MAG TPA: hypothetical protein VFQ42_04255 [Mycobacterium sp.]|nr:hypothetical protein [Mycobacterium sp.]